MNNFIECTCVNLSSNSVMEFLHPLWARFRNRAMSSYILRILPIRFRNSQGLFTRLRLYSKPRISVSSSWQIQERRYVTNQSSGGDAQISPWIVRMDRTIYLGKPAIRVDENVWSSSFSSSTNSFSSLYLLWFAWCSRGAMNRLIMVLTSSRTD